jgi:metallo-beta-lactamase class B
VTETKGGKCTAFLLVQLIFAGMFAIALPAGARGQANEQSRQMNQPVPPFRIIGNIYYVGASDITSYLIVTPAGDILLDGGFAETASQVEANIKTLGFKLSDVKFILNSHAHLDHAGGIAELKRLSGAKFVAMEQDVPALKGDNSARTAGSSFPPAIPDRVIHDGDTVRLGATVMTPHLTPGHTPGCTTWSTVAHENGKSYNVVFVCSASVLPMYKLIERPGTPATYPGIEQDYEKTFRVLKSLPCDVFLAAHGSMYSLTEKREVMAQKPAQNPFIDPWGYQEYILKAEKVFQTELEKERGSGSK